MSDLETPNLPGLRRPALAPASPRNYKELVFRLVILLAFVGSMALLWWTSSRLLTPRINQSRELSSTAARLSADVEEMERKWSAFEAQRLSNRFDQVQPQLFANQATIEAWIAKLKEQVVPLALEFKADVGKPVPQTSHELKLNVIATTIGIDVQPSHGIEGIQTPYQRILQLTHHLATQERRADLVELTVVSGTNSVTRASGILNFWAGEEGSK